jgi:ectoine hydroxylase-related dioxygenase (phytanoyl-CoA dioxygenase family)
LCVFNRGSYWLQFLDRPGSVELAEAVLGGNCHVIGETAWRSHPGYRGEPLHADCVPLTWPEEGVPEHIRVPVFILTVHYYLNDVTAELGPTRLIRGSHRAGRPPHQNETKWNGTAPEPLHVNAGDCLVFRSDIWHAGGDNVTARDVRYLLQVHYGRREMAQHFSPFLEWRFAPDVLRIASKRQRRLLGDHEPGAYD